MTSAQVETPIGRLTVIAGAAGLRYVLWEGQAQPAGLGASLAGAAGDEAAAAVAAQAATQLEEYFAGKRMGFDLPLDLAGTPFQQKAWLALATIPFGTTISYAEQARRVGHPTAVRAVGSANGKNPVPIVLPCHRVVNSGGGLGGFGGGLDVKRTLLGHEAAASGERQ